MQIATEGQSEPNPEPDRAHRPRAAGPGRRAARRPGHRPADVGHRPAGVGRAGHPGDVGAAVGRGLPARCSRALAGSLGSAPPPPSPNPRPADDPMAAMWGNLMGAMAPMVLAMTAGSMLGHLAPAQPRPVRPAGPPAAVATSSCWSRPTSTSSARRGACRATTSCLWVCVHEIAHHAVLGVPHVRAALDLAARRVRRRLPARRPRARGAPRRGLASTTRRRSPRCRRPSATPRCCSAPSAPTQQLALLPRLRGARRRRRRHRRLGDGRGRRLVDRQLRRSSPRRCAAAGSRPTPATASSSSCSASSSPRPPTTAAAPSSRA